MSRTIWKFPLLNGTTRINVSKCAEPLTVQIQEGLPCLWIDTDPNAEQVERAFTRVGTGWDMPTDTLEYIGTFQEGQFVWHIYEVLR